MNQWEREEQAIIEAEARGDISAAEAQRQIRELWRDYRDAAAESAERAYRDELDNW